MPANAPSSGAAFPVRGDLVELPWETADRQEEAVMRAEAEDAEQRLQEAVLRMRRRFASEQRRQEQRRRNRR